MSFSPLVAELVSALQALPGVGQKTAQRLALHVLERDREGGRRLAGALEEAVEKVGHCAQCRNLTEDEICPICRNPRRNPRELCVVETPADVVAIEEAGIFSGVYHVLMGHLSPLDGIGPGELGLDRLEERLDRESVSEVILATSSTVEGEATAQYVSEMARRRDIRITRIAYGIPMGGELEYVDSSTLSHAFQGRREIEGG